MHDLKNLNLDTLTIKAKQWGHWAFARYCAKRDVPFEVCYQAIFGKQPRF